MNIFYIPSWYPGEKHPSTGIFFKEQAVILSNEKRDWNIGISTWGSHDEHLWLTIRRPLRSLLNYFLKYRYNGKEIILAENCREYFSSAFTWTRKIANGNIDGITAANRINLDKFISHFGKPDLIHAHVAYPGGYIAWRLSKIYDIPFVITEHMSPFPMESFVNDYWKFVIPPLKSALKVFTVSKALKRRLIEFDIESEVLSNYIDDDQFNPLDQNTNQVFTFVFVGRLVSQKDPETLLKAASLLLKKGKTFKLKIVGNGHLKLDLIRLSKKLGIKELIEWEGELNRDEIIAAYLQANVLVMPSMHENQPVVMLEALAMGLPVLTTDWEGSEEFIDEYNGMISSCGNIEAFAANMGSVMEMNFNSQIIRGKYIQRNGKKAAIDQIVKKYELLVDLSSK